MVYSQDVTPKIIMLSLQIAIFLAAGCFCAHKLVTTLKANLHFIKYFYSCVLIYVCMEIGLQSYSLYQFIDNGFSNEWDLNILVSINICCIIIDTYLIALLSVYWDRIQNNCRSQIRDSLETEQKKPIKRFLFITVWAVVYLGYFTYFCIQFHAQNANKTAKILLYFVSQGITVILALIIIVIQARSGLVLLNTLKKYQSLIGFTMNQTKFVCIFWMSSVFNTARMFYLIGFTIYYRQDVLNITQLTDVWLQYYIFTFSAIFPIGFYLFGFTIKDSSDQTLNRQDLDSPTKIKIDSTVSKRDKSRSNSKRSSSSYHETELAQSL